MNARLPEVEWHNVDRWLAPGPGRNEPAGNGADSVISVRRPWVEGDRILIPVRVVFPDCLIERIGSDRIADSLGRRCRIVDAVPSTNHGFLAQPIGYTDTRRPVVNVCPHQPAPHVLTRIIHGYVTEIDNSCVQIFQRLV